MITAGSVQPPAALARAWGEWRARAASSTAKHRSGAYGELEGLVERTLAAADAPDVRLRLGQILSAQLLVERYVADRAQGAERALDEGRALPSAAQGPTVEELVRQRQQLYRSERPGRELDCGCSPRS